MQELAVAIGRSIREKRKANGLSQDRFALVVGIDRSYMGRIERGEVSITLQKLYEIAEALQCEPTIFLPKYFSIRLSDPHKANKSRNNNEV